MGSFKIYLSIQLHVLWSFGYNWIYNNYYSTLQIYLKKRNQKSEYGKFVIWKWNNYSTLKDMKYSKLRYKRIENS